MSGMQPPCPPTSLLQSNVPARPLPEAGVAVEMKAICKSFRSVVANSGLNLQIRSGSIHALIGENGAGKSTAMNLLQGVFPPDSGEIWIRGRPWGGLSSWDPKAAIACGIGMVHQHFLLAGPFTVLDNLILGFEKSAGFEKLATGDPSSSAPRLASFEKRVESLQPIARQALARELEALATRYGLVVPLHAKIEDLSVGIHQRIEILKLLYRNADILILDEPTAVLTPTEVAELFVQLVQLRNQGKTILLVTHKLKEVMEIADRVTVMRAGKVVAEREVARDRVQITELAELMVGYQVKLVADPPALPRLGEVLLEVRDLSWPTARHPLHQLSFQVRQGEILGIAGVEGNGQSELMHLLTHPELLKGKWSGQVEVLKRPLAQLSSARLRPLGVGVIGEDRHQEGLLLQESVLLNFLLGYHWRQEYCGAWGILNLKRLATVLQQALWDYQIACQHVEWPIQGLSGGNQQKVIFARELQHEPKLLLAAQPTRGVDVGAIELIHRQLLLKRAAGMGVLLISSELDEILTLSDRIVILFQGRIVAEFQRGKVTEAELGMYLGGGKRLCPSNPS